MLEGRAGTGKTVGAMLKLVWACRKHPGSRHLLCRETRKSMTDTTLVTLESVLGDTNPEVLRVSREQRHSYRINGSEIVCAGLDEPSKAFGSAWGLVVLEEAIESSLDAWELFGRSARDPKLRRRGEASSFPYHQRIAITNPGPPSHWLNRRSTPCPDRMRMVETWDDLANVHEFNRGPQEGVMRRMISVHHDNPAFFDTKEWRWTEAGERYRRSLDRMSGHRRKRMAYGIWAAADGSVYTEFDDSKHVVTPFNIPNEWPVYVAKDPGRDHPDATLFAAVNPSGRIYIIAESCVRNTTTEVDAKRLTEMCRPFNVVRKLGDPHYMFSTTKMSDSGRTIAQQMRDFGHVFEPAPAARNQIEIAQQVDMVRTLLTTIGGDGCPMLQVFRTCANTINGFQTWSYVRNSKGEQGGGTDKFEDVADDEMDCVRMLIASRPTYAASKAHRFGQHRTDDDE